MPWVALNLPPEALIVQFVGQEPLRQTQALHIALFAKPENLKFNPIHLRSVQIAFQALTKAALDLLTAQSVRQAHISLPMG